MNLFGTFTEKPEKVEGNREALEEISQEALDKFDALMGDEDLESEHESEKPEEEETHEPNSKYEIDKDVYETDDTGKTYKKNGQLLPNMEYTIHGNTYRTDKDGIWFPVIVSQSIQRTTPGIRRSSGSLAAMNARRMMTAAILSPEC